MGAEQVGLGFPNWLSSPASSGQEGCLGNLWEPLAGLPPVMQGPGTQLGVEYGSSASGPEAGGTTFEHIDGVATPEPDSSQDQSSGMARLLRTLSSGCRAGSHSSFFPPGRLRMCWAFLGSEHTQRDVSILWKMACRMIKSSLTFRMKVPLKRTGRSGANRLLSCLTPYFYKQSPKQIWEILSLG